MQATSSKSRPNDFYYDPSYNFSGAKDYYKQANQSKLMSAKFAVCPIFPNMFSDVQNYPRKQYVMRVTDQSIPSYSEKIQPSLTTKGKSSQVSGSDRYKYIHRPAAAPEAKVPPIDTNCFLTKEKQMALKQKIKLPKNMKHAKMQTDYRESEMQTSPWQPNYKVIQGDPELLKLDFLKWGCGLPAGEEEALLIERARMKSKWEQTIPKETSKGYSFKKMREIVEQVGANEWIFREKQIEEVQNMRLSLLEKMLNELNDKSKCRNEKRIRQFIDMKLEEKQEKLAKLKKHNLRQSRRLQFQYNGVLSRYGKAGVFEEHADYKSELYVPLMRHGNNPKYANEILSKAYNQYRPQYFKVEDYNTFPRDLVRAPDVSNVKLPGRVLCIKETNWTLPVLRDLYIDLKNLRQTENKVANLRVCIGRTDNLPPTPEVEDKNHDDDLVNECATFIQKIIRGRATQAKIFVGRERCREIIYELRSDISLKKSCVGIVSELKEKRKFAQLEAKRCQLHMATLESSLKKLGGEVAGTLLDFLNKDLQRLLRERRAHAMILLIERVREIREAAEAGRRQQEVRRRDEHDEIFKQVVKVHQDTVDLYLQDIVAEGMQFTSEQQAREYVQKLAEQIEEEQRQIEKEDDITMREEYIATLLHNIVIPEVEKNLVRDRMKMRHKKYLKSAHDEIYSNVIDTLPKPEPLESSTSSSDEDFTQAGDGIDEDELFKAQNAERKLVESDIREILDELVSTPYKISTLKRLVPCAHVNRRFTRVTTTDFPIRGPFLPVKGSTHSVGVSSPTIVESEKYLGQKEFEDDDSTEGISIAQPSLADPSVILSKKSTIVFDRMEKTGFNPLKRTMTKSELKKSASALLKPKSTTQTQKEDE